MKEAALHRNAVAGTREERSSALPHMHLFWIAAGALIVRLVWIHYHGLVIENEGAEYARLAENLIAGKGYVGALGGRQTLFPPLFPLLIALFSQVTGSAESAARAISCLSGVASIWPMYALTRLLGGASSAMVAAILMASHGLMVALSGSAYSESTYFFLLLCALYLALRCFGERRISSGIASGVFFGLAYLVRPEAILYPVMVAGFLIVQAVVARQLIRRALVRALIPGLVTLVFAAPYVTWLSVNSGYFRWEGKTLTNSIIASRMNEGLSFMEAARGLGTNLEPAGVYLIADQFSFKSDSMANTKLAAETVTSDFFGRSIGIARAIARDWSLGGLGLIILAAIGLIASLMERGPRVEKLLFLCVGASYLALLLSLQQHWTRHLFPFVLFALPWVAIGITTIMTFVAHRVSDLPNQASLRTGISGSVSLMLIVFLSVSTLVSVRQLGEFSQSSDVVLKSAGNWLAGLRAGDKTVMSMNTVIAYYARADHAFLPWADESRALGYIHKSRPDFIALRTQNQWQAPYTAKWLTDGIPDACAVRRRTFNENPSEQLVIYEWVCR